jgi:D-alanine-D-alanine ligase
MSNQKKLTVALISGGISSEREVSLRGGDQIFEAMDKKKYRVRRYDPKTDLGKIFVDAPRIDVALINLHGNFGEDGTIQGLLDLLGIPYQGSGVVGSAIAMNKLASKRLYEQAGLPVPPYRIIKRNDTFNPQALQTALGLPLVVKPVQGGSSVGVTIVQSIDSLEKAVASAFTHDDAVVVESYIAGIEITGAVLGNHHLEALPLIEIIPDTAHDFFDYEAKYTAGVTQEICPARIDEKLTLEAQSYAKAAHNALFCKGCSRTDMILKGRNLYVLETNTIPGMTENSLLPLAAKTAGISFSLLIEKLIELGLAADRSRI